MAGHPTKYVYTGRYREKEREREPSYKKRDDPERLLALSGIGCVYYKSAQTHCLSLVPTELLELMLIVADIFGRSLFLFLFIIIIIFR